MLYLYPFYSSKFNSILHFMAVVACPLSLDLILLVHFVLVTWGVGIVGFHWRLSQGYNVLMCTWSFTTKIRNCDQYKSAQLYKETSDPDTEGLYNVKCKIFLLDHTLFYSATPIITLHVIKVISCVCQYCIS